MSDLTGPSAAPANAMSVTSPKPMASRLSATSPSHPMMAMAPAPAHAPMIASIGVANGDHSLTKSPANDIASVKTRPVTVKPSGIRYCSRSVTAMPKRIVPKTATRMAVSPGPNAKPAASQPSATMSSMAG